MKNARYLIFDSGQNRGLVEIFIDNCTVTTFKTPRVT